MNFITKVVKEGFISKDNVLNVIGEMCVGDYIKGERIFHFDRADNSCLDVEMGEDGAYDAPSQYKCLKCWTRKVK